MPYKPKYCCQCGEKIDRIDWKFWMSRRFCELCETDFKIYDRARQILVGSSLLLGLFGIGIYLQKPDRQLNVASPQVAAANTKSEIVPPKTAPQVSTANAVQPLMKSPAASLTAAKTEPPRPPVVEAAEKVYFCGATTKKGTMCSRRVKNGGRCWQHEGLTAMLPQEKLLAER